MQKRTRTLILDVATACAIGVMLAYFFSFAIW